MISAIKLEVYYDRQQTGILDGQSRICNWLYNQLLEKANNLRKEFQTTQSEGVGKTLYTKTGLRNLLPQMKKGHPFLKTVHNKPLKNAALRLSSAIQDYQKSRKGQRKGKHTGWPKYRKWKESWFSLEYCEPWLGYKLNGNIFVLNCGRDDKGKKITLSAAIEDPQALNGKTVKRLEIVKEHGKVYACFTVEVPDEPQKPLNKAIVIDPNHKNIGHGVDGDGLSVEIKNINRLIKRHQWTIDYLKSRRDLCKRKSAKKEATSGKSYWEPSRRWKHFDGALQRAYTKKGEQINHLMYALANRLCRHYDLILMGDYTPQSGTGISRGMRRAMNNESIIGQLKKIIAHVAKKSGKPFDEYKEYNTTKECNVCGSINKGLTLKDREWDCPECKTHHLRDENSAINGFKQNVKNFMSCSDPLVTSRCTWEWNLSEWILIPRKLNAGSDSPAAIPCQAA